MPAAKLFISYAHEDENYRNELVKHLRLLERAQVIELWHDRKIEPGGDWTRAIQQNLSSANIVLLLISSDFIDSDYCYGTEMPAALRAAELGMAKVVPILIRNTSFKGAPFAQLQMLPRDAKAVESFALRDEAWSQISAAIADLAAAVNHSDGGSAGFTRDAIGAPKVEDWNRLRAALLARLLQLDRTDDWQDRRFTELAAEVEANAAFATKRRWFRRRHDRQLRRVPSLLSAIKTTTDRLSLVVGDPGSGKSVSMRHLARQLLQEEPRSGHHAILPVYVNLRAFAARTDADVSASDIHSFVVRSACKGMSEQSAEFLRDYFDWALASGHLLILLDSFDEAPEILSSGEPDATVTKYADAIQSFANGMHDSRVVVASRPYRGPGRMRWSQFRILPLGDARRREFIRVWFDDQATAEVVLDELVQAEGLDGWIDNPLLLSLLCAYRKAHHRLPAQAHEAFESFVRLRISSRPDMLQQHGLTVEQLRETTERIAFAMNAETALGLAPSVSELAEAMRRRAMLEQVQFANVIACLTDLQLGRASIDELSERHVFSFFHRRVQEYFCTCFALRCPDQLNVTDLLENERWRETAVTLLQTASHENKLPLLLGAASRLQQFDAEIQRATGLPLRDLRVEEPSPATINRLRSLHGAREFPWPNGLLHLLGILSDYRVSGDSQEYNQLRSRADACVLSALTLGMRFDQATALLMSNAMSTPARRCALVWAFRSESRWLEDIAFERTGRLTHLPRVIRARVGAMLAVKEVDGDLRRDRSRLEAQVRRVEPSARVLETFRLLRDVRRMDLAILGCLLAPLLYVAAKHKALMTGLLTSAFLGGVLYWMGSRTVRSNAARLSPSDLDERATLLTTGFFAFWPGIFRAGFWSGAMAVMLEDSPIRSLPLMCSGLLIAYSALALRPGIYCAAMTARSPKLVMLPLVGFLPLVVMIEGLWSRLGAATLIVVSGWSLFCVFLFRTFTSVPVARPTDPSAVYVMVGLYGALALVLLYKFFEMLLDRWKLRSYSKQLAARSVVRVLEEAAQFRRDEWRARYLRWIREQQMIAATTRNERVLRTMLKAIEQQLPLAEVTSSEAGEHAEYVEFKAWLNGYLKSDESRLHRWTRSIDEIAQLVDLLRAQLGH